MDRAHDVPARSTYVCQTPNHFPLFFFSSRRRHTRLQGDWCSDVCSSDLLYTRPLTLWRLLACLLSAAIGSRFRQHSWWTTTVGCRSWLFRSPRIWYTYIAVDRLAGYSAKSQSDGGEIYSCPDALNASCELSRSRRFFQ